MRKKLLSIHSAQHLEDFSQRHQQCSLRKRWCVLSGTCFCHKKASDAATRSASSVKLGFVEGLCLRAQKKKRREEYRCARGCTVLQGILARLPAGNCLAGLPWQVGPTKMLRSAEADPEIAFWPFACFAAPAAREAGYLIVTRHCTYSPDGPGHQTSFIIRPPETALLCSSAKHIRRHSAFSSRWLLIRGLLPCRGRTLAFNRPPLHPVRLRRRHKRASHQSALEMFLLLSCPRSAHNTTEPALSATIDVPQTDLGRGPLTNAMQVHDSRSMLGQVWHQRIDFVLGKGNIRRTQLIERVCHAHIKTA